MDNNMEMVYFNQLEMHNHLCICREKGKITPKVKNSLNIFTRSTHQTIKINVYCLCTLPELMTSEIIRLQFMWNNCRPSLPGVLYYFT